MLTQQQGQVGQSGGWLQSFMQYALIAGIIVLFVSGIPQFMILVNNIDFTTPARYWQQAIDTGCTEGYTVPRTGADDFVYDPGDDPQHNQCEQMSMAGMNLSKLVQNGYHNILFAITLLAAAFVVIGLVFRLDAKTDGDKNHTPVRK